jgi:hypothetical protein
MGNLVGTAILWKDFLGEKRFCFWGKLPEDPDWFLQLEKVLFQPYPKKGA